MKVEICELMTAFCESVFPVRNRCFLLGERELKSYTQYDSNSKTLQVPGTGYVSFTNGHGALKYIATFQFRLLSSSTMNFAAFDIPYATKHSQKQVSS